MAVAFVASEIASGVNGATTAAIDTTGADFLVLGVADYQDGPGVTVSDSKSNTWTSLTNYDSDAANLRVRIYYADAPTVGTSHTFTSAGTGVYTCIAAAAFSGVRTASDPYNTDVVGENNFQTAVGAPMSPGPLTATSGDLVVTIAGVPFSESWTWSSISGSYTIAEQSSPSSTEGIGLAYWIATSTGSTDPGWTPSQSSVVSCGSIASFAAAETAGLSPDPAALTLAAAAAALHLQINMPDEP